MLTNSTGGGRVGAVIFEIVGTSLSEQHHAGSESAMLVARPHTIEPSPASQLPSFLNIPDKSLAKDFNSIFIKMKPQILLLTKFMVIFFSRSKI